MEDLLQRKFSTRIMFDGLKNGPGSVRSSVPLANRELRSAFDGDLLHGLPLNTPGQVTLHTALSADGVEVQKNKSYTPCVAKVLNLEGGLGSFMSSLCLFGYFPPSVKVYNSLFRPIAEA